MMDESAVKALQEGQARAIAQTRESLESALHDHNGVLFAPKGFEQFDVETFLPNRRRARGLMTTQNPEAFAEYVATQRDHGASVFVDADAMTAVAVLNLGSPVTPGHADNKAALKLEHTAAYKALINIAGGPRKQQSIVEFFEDWGDHCHFMSEEYEPLDAKQAIAALRHLTIDTARKAESKVGNLSVEASAFERIKAESSTALPVFMEFTTIPYLHLTAHTFKLRMAIHTPDDKAPLIGLQIRNLEEKKQDMAEEFVSVARHHLAAAVPDMPVMVGTYQRST